MVHRRLLIGLVAALGAAGMLLAQPKATELKIPDRPMNVKTQTKFGRTSGVSGQVVLASDDSVTVRSERWKGQVSHTQVYPIDLLAGGKIVDGVWASQAYLWSDIQKGDTVRLEVVHDFGDDRDYCVGVCITRRPGAKLPVGQKPKEDARYARDNLFNDIDNGSDVSDDAIAKVFPETPFNPRTRMEAEPGGLPKVWQEKLDAIRAKKKDDVKATPPEKK